MLLFLLSNFNAAKAKMECIGVSVILIQGYGDFNLNCTSKYK